MLQFMTCFVVAGVCGHALGVVGVVVVGFVCAGTVVVAVVAGAWSWCCWLLVGWCCVLRVVRRARMSVMVVVCVTRCVWQRTLDHVRALRSVLRVCCVARPVLLCVYVLLRLVRGAQRSYFVLVVALMVLLR